MKLEKGCVSLSLSFFLSPCGVLLCCCCCVVVVVCVVCWCCVVEEERLIGPSGCWFPPKFPSGELKLNSFIRQGDGLEESDTCCSRSILKLEMCKIQGFLW